MSHISHEEILEIGREAANYLAPYVTTIIGVMNDTSIAPTYIGTGIYIRFNDHTYIATAQHVADNLHRFEVIMHGVRGKYYPIQGHWVATGVEEADFGVMGCFEELLTHEDKVLDYDNAIYNSNHSYKSLYVVVGFPGKLHTSLDFIKTLQSVCTPVMTNLRGINKNKNGDEVLFHLGYSDDLVAPPGMSGSPVWNLNINIEEKLENWDVKQITFAGVVTRWDEKNQTILATNSELIKQVLPVITNRFRVLYPKTDK